MASIVSGIIEKIQTDGSDGTTHAIASTAYGVCETAASTAIKNVDMTGFKLVDGVTIHVKFANANSAANPKLKFNSETDANAKPIVQYGTTAAGKTSETNGWYAGAVLTLTYDGTSWVRDQGFNTNSNNFASMVGLYNNILARKAITAESLIVGDSTGYEKVGNNVTFDISYPIVWCTAAVSKDSSNYANMYVQHYDRNIATGAKTGFTSSANKAIYLIVTINGNIATIDSNIITDTLPATEDGKVYITLGKLGAQSTGSNYFFLYIEHPMLEYKNGAIRPYTVDAIQQIGNAEDKDYPILLKNTNNTNDETANVKYSNNVSDTVTVTKPFTYNPNTGMLNVPKIQISIKDDSFGFLPYANNWNSLGANNLYWYRAYVTNYYGTTSNITNWAANKNIGTPSSSSVAATLGSVNFYNTCAKGGTQTKTLLTADSTADSDIILTMPKVTGTLALTSDISDSLNNYLPLSGGIMTGNIRRYYGTASTEPMITLLSNNQDIILWEAGHGTAAGTTTTSNHYKLLYKGTGNTGTYTNYLQLIAHNTEDLVAVKIDELGNVSLPQMNKGSATKPIYLNNGIITEGTNIGASAYHADSYFALASHGNHVPTTQTANNITFLRNDNSWYKLTRADVNTLINLLDTGSSNLSANDYVITQYVNGGDTTTTYHRRPASKVVNATLVKAALGTVTTTAKKFLKDTGAWAQVDWTDLSGKPSTFTPSTHTHSTQNLSRPDCLVGMGDVTLQSLVSSIRANRLAFLPASQIIIEKTIDGGTTWTDAGISDTDKTKLFSELRPSIYLPKINDTKNINCGLRITFTAMKYNVPENTAETNKYQYWNSTYVTGCERYCQLKEFYFWVGSNSDGIKIIVQRATGANPNNWTTLFDKDDWAAQGWSGNDYVKISQGTFGGNTTQTGNSWNYRITLFTRNSTGGTTLSTSSTTSAQSIMEIRGYGDFWWTKSNNYMAEDHLYTFDISKNATFPANITATKFIGDLQGNVNTSTSAKWLMNRGTNVTIADSSWSHSQTGAGGTNTSGGTVWKQKWTQSGLTYTPSGGSATTLSDSGDIILWLSQASTSNNLYVNMAIDGYVYSLSGFKGPTFAVTGASSITANIAAGTSSTMLALTNNRPAANISANQWFWGSKYLVTNMIANTNACHVFGKAASNKNSGVLNYHHAGDASNDNYIGIGIYAIEDILKVYVDKRISIQQNLQIPTQSAAYTYGIQFMNSATKKGNIGCDSSGAMCMYGASKIALRPVLDAATDGIEITTSAMIPTKNNTVTLGETNNKWSNVYATTFTGNLTGNANTATKIAAKLATTTKTYLLGTSTTITGTAANVDLIGDTGVYLNTTAGSLSAKLYQINDGTNEKVTLQWNSTDSSLDFIFN